MRFLMVALALALTGPAAAEVLDTAAARKALFRLTGHAVVVSDSLSAQDAKTVEAIIPLMAEQLRQPVRYYAAIAYSPSDGLVHESLQAAMNHHSTGAAARAAVAACMPLRSAGAAPCKVAAYVVPSRYRERPLTLSVEATAAFEKLYRREASPKAFAISPTTGGWGMGAGDAAAIAACAQKSGGARDCEVVIRD